MFSVSKSVMVVTVATTMMSMCASAAEFAGYLNLTTDYVYRGISRSDSHAAAQVGGDVSFDSGLYAGIWGSTIDIGDGVTRQRDLEVIYYGGYQRELSNRWSVAVAAVAYRFPGSLGPVDYSYEEFTASVNYDDHIWVEYAHSPDYYNSGARTHHYEIFGDLPLAEKVSVSGGLGYYDVAQFSGRSYMHWQIGLTRPIGNAGVDLRYHDTNRSVPFVSSPDRARSRVVLSIRFQFR